MTLIREEIPKLHKRFSKLSIQQLIPCNCEVCAKSKKPKFYAKREIERYLEGDQESVYCTESLSHIPIEQLLSGVIATNSRELSIPEFQNLIQTQYLEVKTDSYGKEDELISLLKKSIQIGRNTNVMNQGVAKKEEKELTILFLASSPSDTGRKRMDEEYRCIQDSLRGAKIRDQIKLSSKFALRRKDINKAILDESPNIVHFSGGGKDESGIHAMNRKEELKAISPSALGNLFELFEEEVKCVILNACYSEAQATAISEYIPYVIGMSASIGDAAAVEFAEGFYDALGNGKDIDFAFKLGKNAIDMEGLPESAIPILLKRD